MRSIISHGRLAVLSVAAVAVAGCTWLLLAQEVPPPTFQAYRLQHAQAGDITAQLGRLLSEMNAPHEIVVDGGANRLLITGPEATQRLARQMIETLDRPPAKPPLAPSPQSAEVVRGYPVNPATADKVLTELRQKFPPETGTRIAADLRTSQLIVVAPEEVHDRIAQTLRTPASAPSTPAAASRPRTLVDLVPAAQPNAGRAYALQHVSWTELEDGLSRVWGSRISRTAGSDSQTSTIEWMTATGKQPVLRIDRRTASVAFLGSTETTQLWRRVVQALDRPRGDPEQQQEFVPLRRAAPAKILEAVALVQGAGAAESAAPGSETPPAAGAPHEAPPGAEGQSPAEPTEDMGIDEGGVIGPVQIEVFGDQLLIRGHKRDVERVRKIIEDIERTAKETQPQVELLQLQHIGSQAMSELVTSIYTEILSPRQGQVSIRPLVKPNALLLIGRPDGVNVVKELIAKLDQPVQPETQFEVFQLKHISAVDAQETIENFFVDRLSQAQQAGAQAQQGLRPALGTRVNAVADYRSNALIVQASPSDMEEVRRLIARIDVETTAAANEVRIFRLKNVMASQIAPVLQDALNWQLIGNRAPVGATTTGAFGIGAGVGQTTERARLRSAILTFMTIDATGKKVVESGLLADVRVTADTNGNALVVTGPPNSMGLIEALINELDHLPNAQAQIKVFTILNGDARALSSMLQQLLGQQAQTTQQTLTTMFGQGTLSPFLQPGLQSAAAVGDSSLVPVRFGVDQRTNSIIVTGSEGDLGVVEAILLRLDEQSLREHKTMVYWLANAPAANVAESLNTWIQQRTSLFQAQLQISPESPDIQWNRRVIVVAEEVSNSIIISAAPELFDEVKHVVESLDRSLPLIKIDVLIAQVSLGNEFEFGTEFGLQDSLLFDRQYFGTGTATPNGPGFNFNNQPLGDTGGNRSSLLGQALSTFGLDRIGDLGYGGLVLSASKDSVSMLLRALEQEGRAQILSRPTITTMDSQPANINIGEITARPGETTTTGQGAVTQAVNDYQVGLVLGVTPHVTPEGLVVMEIDAEKSRLDFSRTVEVNGNEIPNIANVNASTTVNARSGQTIVFAGLIETNHDTQVRGIPYLSDLPLLGWLFEYEQESETRSEILIILTPHVIRNDEDSDWFVHSETERMSWCLADVMGVYGNAGFSHRPGNWCECDSETPVIFPDVNPTGVEPVPMDASGTEPIPAPAPAAGPGPLLGPPSDAAIPSLQTPTLPTPPPSNAPPISNSSYQSVPQPDTFQGMNLRYDVTTPTPTGQTVSGNVPRAPYLVPSTPTAQPVSTPAARRFPAPP